MRHFAPFTEDSPPDFEQRGLLFTHGDQELRNQFLSHTGWNLTAKTSVNWPSLAEGVSALLSPEDRIRFVADCIEYILPVYEKNHPGDDTLFEAIRFLRRYADGEETGDAASLARALLLRRITQEVGHPSRLTTAWRPLFAAANGISPALSLGQCLMSLPQGERDDYLDWMRERLLTYLKGESIGGMAEEDAIRLLAETDPVAAISSPDCPVDLWWGLAEKHPIEAMQSILYSLLALESPDRWVALEIGKVENWYDDLVRDRMGDHRLSDQAKRLMAVECAERVLPNWERWYPDDERPQKAIRQATLFAFGLTTKKAMAESNETAHPTRWASGRSAACAGMASASASRDVAKDAASAAVYSAASSAEYAADIGKSQIDFHGFYVWAWRRALEYLAAAPSLPAPWDEYKRSLR